MDVISVNFVECSNRECLHHTITVGYFSYLYSFRDRPASNFIEQVIDIIYQNLIATDCHSLAGLSSSACVESLRTEATQAEWWVHSRPHSSGHQFHFDSDETALYGGEHAQVSNCLHCFYFIISQK